MGFGLKVDYRTKRTLDLDKTYKIIRGEAANLERIRADDIVDRKADVREPAKQECCDRLFVDVERERIYELGVSSLERTASRHRHRL
jgi:hypothetical protein